MADTVIFFDMEFTNFERPELISLGAVTADGKNEFYGEITPIPEGCSDFVKQHVLPLLTGPAYAKDELRTNFLSWLKGLDGDLEFWSDSGYDRNLLYELCGYPLPIPGTLCTWFPLPHSIPNNPHHALEDARLLQKEFGARV